MLPRCFRLHRTLDFSQVRQQGRPWRHPLAILLVMPNQQKQSRFGFMASRGVGNAVTRNRAKRLLREAVHRQMAGVMDGLDCVLIARRATAVASFTEVDTAVRELFYRARMLL